MSHEDKPRLSSLRLQVLTFYSAALGSFRTRLRMGGPEQIRRSANVSVLPGVGDGTFAGQGYQTDHSAGLWIFRLLQRVRQATD